MIFHSKILVVTGMALLCACSGTKHLQEGELLYIGTKKVRLYNSNENNEKVKIRSKADKKANAMVTTWVPPNGSIFGFPNFRFLPIRLYIYNLFYTKNEHKFRHWMMENFGEPPLTVTQVQPEKRLEELKADLFSRGHFEVRGHFKIDLKGRKKNKAKISYLMYPGTAWTYSIITHKDIPGKNEINEILRSRVEQMKPDSGMEFNLEYVVDQRTAILRGLHDNGYLYLRENDIVILSDTTLAKNKVALRFQISIGNDTSKLLKVTVNDVHVEIEQSRSTQKFKTGKDTLFNEEILNQKLIDRSMLLKENELYKVSNREGSVNNFSSMNIFSSINMKFEPLANDSSRVNAILNMRETDEFSISGSGAISTKSNSFLGPSLELKLEQKNVLRGAQNFSYGITGFYDIPTGVYSEASSNSYGLGLSINVLYPIRKHPLSIGSKNKTFLPKGALDFSIDYNLRAEYFELLNFKTSYGFAWRPKKYKSHRINWFSATYSNLLETTQKFDDLAASNEQVRKSFEENFFIGPTYSFIYNKNYNTRTRHSLYFRFDTELSGNVIKGIQSVVAPYLNSTFLGQTYSQFMRFKTDFRYFLNIGVNSKIAFRWQTGIGVALGQSEFMPYILQFYIGGLNSMRPISPRILGPGTYVENPDDYQNFNNIDKTGDVYLEWNLEYRFNLIYRLKGAIWSDVGNIYLLRNDPLRPGGQFEWNNFLNKLIVTGGVGLRLDLTYLILRWDVGTILYSPWLPTDKWIYQNNNVRFGNVIGFGYPF